MEHSKSLKVKKNIGGAERKALEANAWIFAF